MIDVLEAADEVRGRTEVVEGNDPYAMLSPKSGFDACVRLSSAIQLALRGESRARVQLLAQPDRGAGVKLRWGTGITGLDLHSSGGFHGFSGLVGDEGTGKSDLALRAGLTAAADGWEVYYINGELDRFDLAERFGRLAESLGTDLAERAAEHFCVYHLSRGKTLTDIVAFLEGDVLLRQADRAIVIFDTVDTIAAWSDSYLDSLKDLYLWAMGVRVLVPDLISILAVAEPNRDGKGKGRRLEKWADFVVQMKHVRDDVVKFRVTKGRYSGRVDLLEWRHRWQTCSFELEEGKRV
jgi:KaiC/GvpD/RAD55 family RecA-like ATPase